MPWILLATAPDQLTAELWCGLLRNAGIPAMLQPRDTASFLGVSGLPCGLLVDASRVGEAQTLLGETLGNQEDLLGEDPPEVATEPGEG